MEWRKIRTLAALLLMLAAPAEGRPVEGPRSGSGCLDINELSSARIRATGRLKLVSFPGPPNYESIAEGDEEERVFMLELASADCVDLDAETSEMMMDVHVSSSEPKLMDALRRAVGRKVTVRGEAFAAHTGHHRSPVVVLADRVSGS
jgi:hypothetical protein